MVKFKSFQEFINEASQQTFNKLQSKIELNVDFNMLRVLWGEVDDAYKRHKITYEEREQLTNKLKLKKEKLK